MRRTRVLGAIAMTSAMIVMAAGCSAANGDMGGLDGDPIVVASVNSLSGPASYPESSAAAKAVFDEYNANGGLGGRPIEYVVLDDKGDPTAASSAARDAVSSRDAVALVGSASILDCEINSAYYEENGIASIQGTGVDPFCFTTPNISPVNVGPFVGAELTLTHATETLDLKSICGFFSNATGSWRAGYEAAIDRWSAATGNEFTLTDFTIPYSLPDFTPYVIQAKDAGCDAIFFATVEPDALGMLKAASSQGLSDMTFLFLTSTYTESFAAAADFVGAGVYAMAEFAPYTDASVSGNEEWATLMQKHNVPLTSFAQGGYLAAHDFIDVLESIDGDVTRTSITEALKSMESGIKNLMVGTDWIFGSEDAHSSNYAGWPIVIDQADRSWLSDADDWLILAQ